MGNCCSSPEEIVALPLSEIQCRKSTDFRPSKTSNQIALTPHFDKDFPPNNVSYYGSDDADLNEPIIWKRASEIAQHPLFFDHQGATRFDVNQGEPGNCWFLAALSDLPMYPKLFKKVVDPDQNFDKSQGKFLFRIWDFGEWKTIEVDDFLPTFEGGQLRGVSSQNSAEFWSALAEKAYAKHHGNYATALDGGFVAEALEDLTGGIGEEIFMSEIRDHQSEFFLKLLQAYKTKSMMSASILTSSRIKEENGLVCGHAYSLNKVIEFKLGNETVQLLRIRNPWGSGEFRGQWSDGCKKWENLPSEIKDKLDFHCKVDGEFYISLPDFCEMFDQVTICHLSMDSIAQADEWKMAELEGSWTKINGGLYANLLSDFSIDDPQFLIELNDTDKDGFCTVLVSVLQKAEDRKSYGSIGFKVFRADETLPLSPNFIANGQIEESHQTQIRRAATKRLRLKPGKFVIIPHSGSGNKNERFLVRIFYEGRGDFKRLK